MSWVRTILGPKCPVSTLTSRSRRIPMSRPHLLPLGTPLCLNIIMKLNNSQLSAGYCHFGWLVGKSCLSRLSRASQCVCPRKRGAQLKTGPARTRPRVTYFEIRRWTLKFSAGSSCRGCRWFLRHCSSTGIIGMFMGLFSDFRF